MAEILLLEDGEEVEISGKKYKVSQSMLPTPVQKKRPGIGRRSVQTLGGIILSIPVGLLVIGTAGLMSLSKKFSQYLVAKMQPSVMEGMHKAIRNIKAELLKDMKGAVLDFGCGNGLYLRDVSSADGVNSIVSLEPNINLHEEIQKNATRFGVETDICGKFSNQLIAERGENVFDFVIVGNVLCEVSNQLRSLHE
mmetsp:Transcript_12824/g.16614  ORF Transcript_12824/g.16614 Transcript_12824/m.16614 type:complete len:195 (-) Transcript_12824:1118-1702(-)